MRFSYAGRVTPLALALGLAFVLPQSHAQVQAPATPPVVQQQPTVVVTGSRIARAQAEGASPVTVIKSEDLDRLGFKNVADALNALTENTGFTQGEDFGNTFTPAANAISLRGLGPNHTLTLINGRRVADYPQAYDGSVNFVDLSNIPSALIDRIEILNGGASAVYGSDAIAGVVNIILKKQAEGVTLNLKAGGTQLGGGENARAQITGGIEHGKLSGVWGVELSTRQPIWSRQRSFMDDTTLGGSAPSVVFGRKNASAGTYIAPPAGACGAGKLFAGSVSTYTGSSGSYCGSGEASPTYWTTQTGKRSSNFAAVLNYALTPTTELFAEGLLGFTSTENNTRGPSWTSLGATSGYFQNANTGQLETLSRRFAPEELGSVDRYDREWKDQSGNLALGVRGELSGSWSYEAVFNTSADLNKATTPRLLAGIDSYFLGPQLGTTAAGAPIYAPNLQNFYTPLTPAQFSQLLGSSVSNNKAWNNNLTLSASGVVTELPAGPLQAAVLAEAGEQGFSNNGDPRLGQGVFYNASAAANASGRRSRAAIGAELSAPLTQLLTATVASRYDDYHFAGRDDGSLTYKLGLEFRPRPDLLLRAHASTAFRAPDMNYIFTAQTAGYYPSSTDYYRCAQTGQPLATCTLANVSPGFNFISTGSPNLKSEKGKSYGLGLVWSPSKEFDASLDFWKIAIDDLVTDLDPDRILRQEALCRTGQADINSPTCVDALNRVHRNPLNAVVNPGAVNYLAVNPINASSEATYGFDVSARYLLKTAAAGDFILSAKYTQVQAFLYQQYPGDPQTNQIGDLTQQSDWPSKLTATLTWRHGNWQHTLTGLRNGAIPNGAQTAWLGPYWTLNASTDWELSPRTRLSLSVNNLLGIIRKDPSGGWPYYPVGYYSPHGRQGWISFEHRFDS